jgi:hypothetical protein
MNIKIASIRIDGGTQARAEINQQVVGDYADHLRGGGKLPRITLFFDGAEYWLADGFHRYHAHKRIEALEIDAEVIDGDRRAAVLHSVGANVTHGLRRSNADKRKAVETLLADEEWGGWSNRKIAEKCAVSEALVRDARESICEKNADAAVRTVERGGKVYQQNTANIGKSGGCSRTTPAQSSDGGEVSLPKAVEQIAPEKPAKPKLEVIEGGKDQAELDALREENAELRESLADMARDLEAYTKNEEGEPAAVTEIKRLNDMLRTVESQRDDWMRQCAEMKKQIKRLEGQIAKSARAAA